MNHLIKYFLKESLESNEFGNIRSTKRRMSVLSGFVRPMGETEKKEEKRKKKKMHTNKVARKKYKTAMTEL